MTNTANRLLDPGQLEQRIEYLAGFMTQERREVLERALAMRTRYVTVLAENTFHAQNAAALVRHCDAFGVQELHAVETVCPFEPSASVVRGTDKWIDIRRHGSVSEALGHLRGEGYRIVATTPHRGDCTPEDFDVARSPFVLVFGTEHAGVSEQIIREADEFLRIPMCGLVESLNVSASAAILLHALTQRVRAQGDRWRMSRQQRCDILYRWMCVSVKDSQRLLERRFGSE